MRVATQHWLHKDRVLQDDVVRTLSVTCAHPDCDWHADLTGADVNGQVVAYLMRECSKHTLQTRHQVVCTFHRESRFLATNRAAAHADRLARGLA